MRSFSTLILMAVWAVTVNAQAGKWQQCGGKGFTGPTTCVDGTVCTYLNDFYSQCLPGGSASQPSKSTTVTPPSTTPPKTPPSKSTTVTPPSTTPPKTLPPGYTTTVIYPTPSTFTTVYDGHTETVTVDPWPTTPITLTIPIPTPTSSIPATLPPGYTTTVIYPTPSSFTTVYNGHTETITVDPFPTDPITLTIPIATDSASATP